MKRTALLAAAVLCFGFSVSFAEESSGDGSAGNAASAAGQLNRTEATGGNSPAVSVAAEETSSAGGVRRVYNPVISMSSSAEEDILIPDSYTGLPRSSLSMDGDEEVYRFEEIPEEEMTVITGDEKPSVAAAPDKAGPSEEKKSSDETKSSEDKSKSESESEEKSESEGKEIRQKRSR